MSLASVGLASAVLAILLSSCLSSPATCEPRAAETEQQIERLLFEGRYAAAEARARSLLGERERHSGSRSLEVADVLDLLVESLYRGGKRREPETIAMAERAVEIREERADAEDLSLARSLHNLGTLVYHSQDYERTRSLFERSLAIRRRLRGADHPDVARSLMYLGELELDLGEIDRARETLEQALAIAQRADDPDHLEAAEGLNFLAKFHYRLGDFDQARRLFTGALEIRETVLGDEHPLVATCLHNLGSTEHVLGDYTRALELYERALAIRLAALDPGHPQVASTLAALATTQQATGDYAGARRSYERALDSLARRLGEDHLDYAHTLKNLAFLAQDSGDLAEATRLHRRVLEIRRRALGDDHTLVAASLADVGHVMQLDGDSEGARDQFEKALRIQKSTDGVPPRELASTLTGLAHTHVSTGEITEAKRLYETSAEIFEQAYGPDHPSLIWPLTDLAELMLSTGEFAEARRLLQRALRIAEAIPGSILPQVAMILYGEGRALAGLERFREAEEVALRAEEVSRAHVRVTSHTLSERQALTYASHVSDHLHLVLSVLIADPNPGPGAERRVWDALIRSRALVLDEMTERHRAVRSLEDRETLRLNRDFVSARERLANLMVRGSLGPPSDQLVKLTEEARRRCEEAEKALAEQCVGFRRERERRELGLDGISEHLPPESALLAFTLFKREELSFAEGDSAAPARTSVPTYLAFVKRSDRSQPECVNLGVAAGIDTLVASWKREASQGCLGEVSADEAEAAYRRAGSALKAKIWDPLAPALTGAERVFVVPDGNLNLVNFIALPVGSESYLVETGPVIHLLSAERDLVPSEAHGPEAEGLLALGAPDFDARVEPAILAADHGTQIGPSLFRGQAADCGDFPSHRFTPLPAAAREVDELIELWASVRPGPDADPVGLVVSAGKPRSVIHLAGAEASEEALKRLAPGRRILHLATHGFFLDGRCPPAGSHRGIGGLVLSKQRDRVDLQGENPLRLSGLALAGANRRNSVDPGEEDGILTAEEIATLQLSGMEWAVLSACDTGVGEILAGEGVLGLRRAFRIAGARTLIMSLWSVEDEAARIWMRGLYEGRLVRGLDTANAVHGATLAALRARRQEGRDAHPFYWAGFVAAGDWR